jgi:catechol 2,3-dioxygenase-like lactoylglutathione lyase family enzyme
MGFHHLAIATKDVKATHGFYTGAMGFELVKVEVGGS